ncbi:MAG: sugar phosphate isomerase/epimerase family protein [Tepidisphaeraceae bacterium]|jgi:hexulose-6-phosphate isomerase
MSGSTRREFLVRTATAAALAAAAVPGMAQVTPAPATKRKLKKGVVVGMIEVKGTWTDKFKALKAAGFDGVQMDSPLPAEAALKDVLAARDAAGIEIEGAIDATHWSVPLSDADPKKRERALADLKTALRECKEMGGGSVLLVPGVVNRSTAYDDVWKRSQEVIRQAIPTAEETKVKIAIENVWNQFIMSPMEAVRYLEEINHPLVGWHFDIGNVVTYGWPEQWIRILGKRLFRVHLKDYSRKKRDDLGLWKGFDVELGEGDVDWAAAMKAFDDIGYDGWCTAEVAGGDEKRLKFLAQRIDSLFAK